MGPRAIPERHCDRHDTAKRRAWLLSLLVPALAGAGPLAWFWLQQGLALLLDQGMQALDRSEGDAIGVDRSDRTL